MGLQVVESLEADSVPEPLLITDVRARNKTGQSSRVFPGSCTVVTDTGDVTLRVNKVQSTQFASLVFVFCVPNGPSLSFSLRLP